MRIERFVVGPFQENCYLVADETTGTAVLIDPGDEGEAIVAAVRDAGLTLEAIWLTHAHLDHIGGIAAIMREFDVPVFLHDADIPVYNLGPTSAQLYGVPFEAGPLPDRSLHEGDVMSLGSLRFDVWHMPGHAPGHVIFHGHGVVLGGDVLFAGSVGRTDLPFCDGKVFQATLARMATLPPETVVLPGHGEETTLAAELEENPFLTGLARPLRR
ncbi:MAG: MBL fold metallo-hydrolase [Gemmatimonadota bacterium]